jgi:hypothetical protein
MSGWVLPDAAADSFAGAALDAAELLDIDVHELAGSGALVANGLLESDPAEPAHADPGQDPRDRRERHPQCLGDLGRSEAQAAQLDDRVDAVSGRAVGYSLRRGGAIQQPCLALASIATYPPASTADTDTRSLSRRRQRPPLNDDTRREPPAATPTECRVTVKLHPGRVGHGTAISTARDGVRFRALNLLRTVRALAANAL